MATKSTKVSKIVKKSAPAKAKAPVKKPVAAKSAVKKPVDKPVSAKKPMPKAIGVKFVPKTPTFTKPAVVAKPAAKSQVDKKGLEILKNVLMKMRDRLTGQITALSDDSLKYIDDASSEDRTDDFDREFALNLVSSEHDAIFEIDGALRRIAEGTYGMCDACTSPIDKVRLNALPFARMCVKCQSDQEKGRSRFRPFGDTIAQGVEASPEPAEVEETE